MEKNAPPTAEIAMVFVQGFSWWGAIHAFFREKNGECCQQKCSSTNEIIRKCYLAVGS